LKNGISQVYGALFAVILFAGCPGRAGAACTFEPQGEGRVSAVLDVRTFRLGDNREIRLAAVEPAAGPGDSSRHLSTLIEGRDIELRGQDDAPDRYGRQIAFAFVAGTQVPVQVELLKLGDVLFSGLTSDKTCAADLAAAEADARNARRGIWADPAALKNAERPGDILAVAGRFAVVEGKVLSVRQAGATFYVNFSRRFTEGFAATISRRMIASLETAGLAPNSLENRRIRVRGWVEQRGGPRIEIFRSGQIELVGEK
jgi:hypothetical protein